MGDLNYKTLARATLRNARITDQGSGGNLHVEGTPLLVRPSAPVWSRYHDGFNLKGHLVDVRIVHLLLDPGTQSERVAWSARVLGDIK